MYIGLSNSKSFCGYGYVKYSVTVTADIIYSLFVFLSRTSSFLDNTAHFAVIIFFFYKI